MKHEKLVKDILRVIDKENIKDVFFCVTRLRFILKDVSKVDKKALENIDGIMQVKTVGDQLQLVVGSKVQSIYNEFCEISGIQKNEKVDAVEEEKKKFELKNLGTNILNTLSSIFVPVMPVLVAGGMMKSLVLILSMLKVISPESSIMAVLNAISDTPFYFLPFMVGYTTAKKFKLNELFGLMIAGVLLYPTFMNQTAGKTVSFFFLSIPSLNYASSVLPTILSVIAFAYLYKLVDRFIPSNLKLVFSGLITFTIFMPILLAVVAPIGNYLGIQLSNITVGLFSALGPVAGALFAGFMPFIIMAGMHTALAPIMIQNLSTLGYDFLLPAFFINNIAVAGATLGAAFKIKDSKMKAAAFSSGGLGIIGITEPALYSISIPYKKPLFGAMIGGAVGGFIYTLLKVVTYAYTMPGIFSLPTYIHGGSNLIKIIISVLAAFIASFVYSFIFTKDKKGVKVNE